MALEGVHSVLAQYEILPGEPVTWPGWYETTSADTDRRWLRADTGGLVETAWGPYPIIREGETICRITDHFRTREEVVEAPFDGLLIGVRENPVAAPGHPLCHLLKLDEDAFERIESAMRHGAFDGYRQDGGAWGDD